MTDLTQNAAGAQATDGQGITGSGSGARDIERLKKGLRARHRNGAILKYTGLGAIGLACLVLGILLWSIVSEGYSGFFRTMMTMEVTYAEDVILPEDGEVTPQNIRNSDYATIALDGFERVVGGVPDDQRRTLQGLLSPGVRYQLQQNVLANPDLIGTTQLVTVPAASVIDMAQKGKVDLTLPEERRLLNDQQVAWYETLRERGHLSTEFYWGFFTNNDSRSPELAGLWAGIKGSFFMMVIVLCAAFPIAVAAAIYLEEFAPKNRWTELIEVNINNLAAVPSIIFGLLGLAVFLQTIGLPRSSPLAGGAVLTLMTLPIIIIAARSALRSVPPSYREGALMMGASRQQAVMMTVLPSAMPGMLTGTIIGLAQALGETAPLLLIGMVAFVATAPDTLTDTATALPVQVYLWAEAPERGFREKTQAAIMVLLGFLLIMNTAAVILRNRFQKRR